MKHVLLGTVLLVLIVAALSRPQKPGPRNFIDLSPQNSVTVCHSNETGANPCEPVTAKVKRPALPAAERRTSSDGSAIAAGEKASSANDSEELTAEDWSVEPLLEADVLDSTDDMPIWAMADGTFDSYGALQAAALQHCLALGKRSKVRKCMEQMRAHGNSSLSGASSLAAGSSAGAWWSASASGASASGGSVRTEAVGLADDATPVPEPTSIVLLGTGLLFLGFSRSWKSKN